MESYTEYPIMTDQENLQAPEEHAHHLSSHHADTAQGDNCISCRVIGSTLPIAISGYILYAAKQRVSSYTGLQRIVYLGLCAGLSAGLMYLGGSRLFRKETQSGN
ncbi:hypothetical protein CRM22_009645 [Opisthorchis felineus]|uniref:DUF4536 domain-containing protein n=2 Tax=Opisthorchis felineus TaxID=147828 RepID=A0A4S2L6T1_OPIFE|nr:hypothetical protein CRM22_009645 [Opisthorchis felineus]